MQALRRHVPGGGNQRLGAVTAHPVGALHGDDVTGIQVAGGKAQWALAHQAAFHDNLQGLTLFNEGHKEDSTVLAKRANTPRNHEFRIWNIFRREYTQGILHAQYKSTGTAQRTTQRIRLHARHTQRLQMAQTVLSLIATIQAAQLQKTIQHTQRAGSKTVPRRRTHLISSLKNMAKHRKIQRHPPHTQRRRLLHQRRHHKLHHTIRRLRGAAHNIQR